MHDLWIRFGCFLTGYNYNIVRTSSEVAAKAVKRYTSALLIACILWSFTGFMFTQRYFHGGTAASVIGALIMVIIIVQIERQIILSVNPSKLLLLSRGMIAILMAIIGTIIIDQIMFKEDIELEKISFIDNRVKKDLPLRTEDLRTQISSLDTTIQLKEIEKTELIGELNKSPFIKSTTMTTVPTKVENTSMDSATGRVTKTQHIVDAKSVTIQNVPNPKQSLIAPLDQMIIDLRSKKTEKEKALLDIRPKLREEVESRVGFLDELKIMYNLIIGSGVALGVWFIWFFFLMGLEMLVLISKSAEKGNDYEETVLHQMNLQIKKLQALARLSQDS